MPSADPRQRPPTWVTDAVGPVDAAERAPWGFTNESWRVTTRAGRSIVVTRMQAAATAGLVVRRGQAVAAALASVGIISPQPAATSQPAVVVSDDIPGRPGMELLQDARGAEGLGRIAGKAWRDLARVETTGLGLDELWGSPIALADAGGRWLAALDPSVEPGVVTTVRRALGALPGLLARQPLVEPRIGFVHGDFAPPNILVEPGRLAALLDLETVRAGDRLLDAAWFRWMVRYHHPGVERDAWRGFVDGSGTDMADPTVRELLDLLPTVRILEILGEASNEPTARVHWASQLRASAARLRLAG